MTNATADKGPGERLTISLLLLWITATAIMLAMARVDVLSRGTIQPETAQEAFRDWLFKILSIATAPVGGAGLCAIGLGIHRWRTGGPKFPSQPGHVLLIAIGMLASVSSILFLTEFALPSFSRLLQFGPNGRLGNLTMRCGPAATTATAIILITGRDQFPIYWRLGLYYSSASLVAVFAWIAFMYDVEFYVYTTWSVGVASGVGVFCAGDSALLIASSVFDLITKRRYDILHWAGVVGWPLLLAALLISYWY